MGRPLERTGWSVGIVVPARDEIDLVDSCVDSLLALTVPDGVDTWIIVVADACGDGTARAARRRLGGRGEVRVASGANVGSARAAGAAGALDRFRRRGRPLHRTWLLTTDADSMAPTGWLVTHLRQAEAGAVAVAGTVAVESFDQHAAAVPARYREQYVVHADGTHPHVHGANLGVRADAYLAVGGWRPLATREDHDLWDRLRAGGRPIISTIEAPVVTSGRRIGRAPDGFAGLLGDLGEAGR